MSAEKIPTVGGYVQGCIAWPAYGFWTMLLGGGIAVSAILGRRDGSARALGFFWGRALWMSMWPWWRRTFLGLENVGQGPYVIVANHRSVADIPLLLGLPLSMCIGARPGIFRVALMGRFLRWSEQVDTAALLDEGEAALRAGLSVLVFPEGSRSSNGEVGRFRRGAFELAHRAGVPVLPVAVAGSEAVLPKHGYVPLFLFTQVVATVLPPVQVDDPRDQGRAVRAQIAAVLA